MKLEAFINNIQKIRLKDSDDALKSIASSEKYLQQAYEGRYLFELIQNVRDANKIFNSIGSVFIELEDGLLIISNTGAPFNEKGINSITTIGDSPKDSQDFIGFKGIGFKSVYEISETPIVTTEWGSVLFDKEKTRQLLNGRKFKNRNIPLFFIPHFSSDRLSNEELQNKIVTKILLPLKSKVTKDSIVKAFDVIGVHQILLLGCLKNIKLSHKENISEFDITEDNKSGHVVIRKNEEIHRFKHFKPSEKIIIPKHIIDELEDKEKEIFEKEPFVDISVVFDINEKGKISENKKSKLYLFYPLEITSGFNFIIHSYFIVNPERKALRNSPLNKFILESIADYLSSEWLVIAKKQHRANFLDFLAFERNEEAPILNHLYDRLVKNISNQKILYDKITKRFYRTDEIILADGFDKELFPDNMLNNKRLIYVSNSKTRDWLKTEFKIEYLSYNSIAENIEKECQRQKRKNNLSYFEHLYKYLVEHDDLNLKGKKVLLTSKMKLLSNEEDVFYGLKDKIEFPESIQKKIHFIHPKITISDQRQGKGQLGFIEYNTELLVRRLMKMYDDKSVYPKDILSSLLNLPISERLQTEVKQKVLLPVQSEDKWLNPYKNPIYIKSSLLLDLYSKEKFIDYNQLPSVKLEPELLSEKLLQLGAWDIPAVYFSDKKITLNSQDKRYKYLNSITSYSTPYYELKGDWLIDIPATFNTWFTDTIINNWDKYIKVIEDENNFQTKYNSQTSNAYPLNRNQIKNICSAFKFLKEEKWIVLNENSTPVLVREVVGVDPIEILQTHSLLLKKYIKILPIQYSYNADFIELMSIKHLDSENILTFSEILNNIHELYAQKNDVDKEFISFYNIILNKLFDLFNYPTFNKANINELKETVFLGLNEVYKILEWKSSNQIYYIEDKPSYEILPNEIKKIIQPHFTNRNKNKFGQIAKRIGLDFKKVIEQEVINVDLIEEVVFCEWFPSLSESIAFVECLLESNLEEYLNDIKEIRTKRCLNFSILLYKDSNQISSLENILFKIQYDGVHILYVRESINIKKNIFHANVLYDLLTELLGRDLSRIRLPLIDFFSQDDKISFLDKYEVPLDRIEEIKSKLTGFTLTKQQLFWLPILSLKKIINPLDYFKEGIIDFSAIAIFLKIPHELLIETSKSINYNLIQNPANINSLHALFEILKISVSEYNLKSEIKLDFRQYLLSQIEGIKQKNKLLFSNKLHKKLSSLSTSEQCMFQDILDQYSSETIVGFDDYVIQIDIEEEFIDAFNNKYPDLIITKDCLHKKETNNYLDLFKENEVSFKNNIKSLEHYEKLVDEFLSININRSLLYFENSLNVLFETFKSKLENSSFENLENNKSSFDLSQYENSTDLDIKKESTSNIEKTNSTKGNKANSGNRVDGSKQNPKNDLIGIVAEKSVYDILVNKFNSTEWISKNAAKAGVNPEGSDIFGCDITYVDELNQIQYIEVKGKIDNQNHFYISYPEYCKAIKEKENYRIILVKFALNNQKREIIDIGNIFLLEDHSDVFNNNRFTANFNSLEIVFE